MKFFFRVTVFVLLAFFCFEDAAWSAGSAQRAKSSTSQTEQVQTSKTQAASAIHGYHLSPQKQAEVEAYSHIQNILYFSSVALVLLIYFLFWRAGIAMTFRNWARRVSRRHLIQCLIFAPLFFIAANLLEFPFDYYSGYVIGHKFGLLTQGFNSWLKDWGMSVGILIIVSTFVVWVFYAIVRRSPRRWWFYFWAATIPMTLFVIFVEPFVVAPLFYKFKPLDKTHPALVTQIEEMLHRADLKIPRSRILEMDASSKTNTINAYVSGLGASKRVVVWNTTLKKLTDDETLAVVGHETGHYVLHHIVKEFILIELVTLVFFALGFVAIKRLIRQFGSRTGLEGEGDLASLAAMLMVLTALTFFSSPVVNAISRHYEHQADQFALEVTYGVIPDPNAAEAGAFQVIGEQDLANPHPNPFMVFWLYSHPPIPQRIQFALHYKPWAEGKPLKLIPQKKS